MNARYNFVPCLCVCCLVAGFVLSFSGNVNAQRPVQHGAAAPKIDSRFQEAQTLLQQGLPEEAKRKFKTNSPEIPKASKATTCSGSLKSRKNTLTRPSTPSNTPSNSIPRHPAPKSTLAIFS